MLSRTADNLYWLARYVERAEYLARILEATQRLANLPLAYGGSTNEWASVLATAGATTNGMNACPLRYVSGAIRLTHSPPQRRCQTDWMKCCLRVLFAKNRSSSFDVKR